MTGFWKATYEVARKEVLQHLRTKRLYIVLGLMALALALMTLVFGPDVLRGFSSPDTSREHMVMLFYFSSFFIGGFFFVQLLAIVLTSDAVCSEWGDRTIFLLLSKPVSRSAFVTGKFLGSFLVVAAAIVALFGLDYALIQPAYTGAPSGSEVAGFFGALGVLVLGAAAFSALALFFSTLSRSTALSILATLAVWILVFPIIAQIGLFTTLGDEDFQGDFDDPRIDWSRYLSPATSMTAAAKLLVPADDDRMFLEFFGGGPAHIEWAIMALLGHTALFFGLALFVVQRRNFE